MNARLLVLVAAAALVLPVTELAAEPANAQRRSRAAKRPSSRPPQKQTLELGFALAAGLLSNPDESALGLGGNFALIANLNRLQALQFDVQAAFFRFETSSDLELGELSLGGYYRHVVSRGWVEPVVFVGPAVGAAKSPTENMPFITVRVGGGIDFRQRGMSLDTVGIRAVYTPMFDTSRPSVRVWHTAYLMFDVRSFITSADLPRYRGV